MKRLLRDEAGIDLTRCTTHHHPSDKQGRRRLRGHLLRGDRLGAGVLEWFNGLTGGGELNGDWFEIEALNSYEIGIVCAMTPTDRRDMRDANISAELGLLAKNARRWENEPIA